MIYFFPELLAIFCVLLFHQAGKEEPTRAPEFIYTMASLALSALAILVFHSSLLLIILQVGLFLAITFWRGRGGISPFPPRRPTETSFKRYKHRSGV